jgi:hydrophobic/amphiphilic exporter-1 (mainly G- bacteria), HAE1 family
MSWIERSIRYPVTVTVIVAMIVLFGGLALFRIPVQLTPTVDQPVITVTTQWFGASAEEVLREITEEQEDYLKQVSGIRRMTSSSSDGQSQIRLEFNVGVNKPEAMNEVRDKLRQVRSYPEQVDEPVVEASDEMSRDYIAWFVVEPIKDFKPTGPLAPGYEEHDITKLRKFFDDFVVPVMERAEGVSDVQLLGGREREVQIRIDLSKLAARGIGIDRLVDSLRGENLDVTAGSVTEGKRETTIRVLGQYESPVQVEETVVAYTQQGQPVYMGDIGSVKQDFKKEVTFVHHKGTPVIAMNAQRELGTNSLTVMSNLQSAVREVNTNVLGPTNWGIKVTQVYDQTEYINQAVLNARDNLIIGGLLAGIVLFATLRSFGATMVVLVSIPISVIGTILGMAMLGRSLNVISMAGMTFAVGMGVDNAIVVLENIFRHREMGKDRFTAAIDGTKEVWGAIVAATLTNVAVFLPMIFIQQEAGQLFRDISVALTIAFFFYLFVSPTLIPMLATLFLRKMPAGMHHDASGMPIAKTDTLLGRMTAPIGRLERAISQTFYAVVYRLTRGVLVRLALVAVMIVVPALIAWRIMPPTDYLPSGNQNFVFGLLIPPPGYSMDEFRSMASTVEGQLGPWWEAKDKPEMLKPMQEGFVKGMQGAAAGMRQGLDAQREQLKAAGKTPEQIALDTAQMEGMIRMMENAKPPPAMDQFFFGVFGSFVFMGGNSVEPQNVQPISLVLNSVLGGSIPGTFGFASQMSIFPSAGEAGSSIGLAVTGVDREQVTAAAGAMMMQLGQNFGFQSVRPDPGNFNLGRNETRIVVDRVRAASARVGGVPTIRDMAQVAVDGLVIGDFREQGQTVDLTVVTDQPRTGRLKESLAYVPLATASGDNVVPMGSVVSFVDTASPESFKRIDELPAVSFTVQLPPSMSVNEGVDILEKKIIPAMREQQMIAPQVSVRLEGSADKLQEFLRAFIPGFIIAAIVTYLLLAALFENWLHPITIMMSVPCAMVGGFALLAIVHHYVDYVKLDVLTMLGFVILIGTIINNPILIVHQALNYLREGMEPRKAVALSTQTRVRPIFMSVITSVAGMAPLVAFAGAGSELYRGLGAVIVGGLMVSTIFTLILTPILMSLLLDLQSGVRGLFVRAAKTAQPVTDAPTAAVVP